MRLWYELELSKLRREPTPLSKKLQDNFLALVSKFPDDLRTPTIRPEFPNTIVFYWSTPTAGFRIDLQENQIFYLRSCYDPGEDDDQPWDLKDRDLISRESNMISFEEHPRLILELKHSWLRSSSQ